MVLTRQIRIIQDSRPLQYLGAAFACVHIVIFLSGIITLWWIPYFLSSDSVPICPAFFENCYQYRLSFETWKWLWYGYGILAFLGPALFLLKKIRSAYFLLLLLVVFEIFVTFADYRIWYSHFYISSVVVLPFLFFADKPRLSAMTLALCYWWAGMLKLNHWWLSGEVLQKAWKIFPQWLPLQASFVVFMELFLVWLLFSKRPKVFWPTFGVFVLFHLFSWHIVGFFYPLVMFCVLPVFLVNYRWQASARKGFLRLTSLIFLATLSALQIPAYFQNENAYMYGGGRMFYSLHMFHRRVVCRMEASYLDNGEKKKIDLAAVVGYVAPRLACEPLVSFDVAKYLCRKQNFPSPLRVEHWSKFDGQEKDRQIYAIDDFCHQQIKYHFWGKNSWINPVEE